MTNNNSYHQSIKQRSHLTASVTSVAFALAFLVAGVAPSVAGEDETLLPRSDQYFDLGIDATNLPKTVGEARIYMASLSPDTFRVITASCEHFSQYPGAARLRETVTFCDLIGL